MRQTNAVHLFLRDTPGKRLPCLHVQAFAGQRTANGFAVELAAIRRSGGCRACMSRSSLRYGPCWTRATGTQHHLPGNGQRQALPGAAYHRDFAFEIMNKGDRENEKKSISSDFRSSNGNSRTGRVRRRYRKFLQQQ